MKLDPSRGICWKLLLVIAAAGLRWKDGRISEATLLARNGRTCRVRPAAPVKVAVRGRAVSVCRPEPGLIEFKTEPGATYALTPAGR